MTTPDKAQQPEQDPQELNDEDLNQASGGKWVPSLPAGVDSELANTTHEEFIDFLK